MLNTCLLHCRTCTLLSAGERVLLLRVSAIPRATTTYAQSGQQSGSEYDSESESVQSRYASLFNSYVGLLSAAEDSRPLLLIGMGARGMGPLRAALEWTPVQAHATANPVTLFYVAQGQQSAAYLADWDQWREAGVGDTTQSLCLSLGRCLHSLLQFLKLCSSCCVS